MLTINSKYTNLNAQSTPPDSAEVIANFTANNDGSCTYFTYNIANQDLYKIHHELVDTDFVAFKNEVLTSLALI